MGGGLAVASVAVLAWGWSTGRVSLGAIAQSDAELMAVRPMDSGVADEAGRSLVFLPEPAGWRGGEAQPADERSFGGSTAHGGETPGGATDSVEPAGEAVSFDGRPLRAVRTITMKVTAYSPDEESCGIWADGRTASGYSVWTNGMKLVAADTRLLPFGTILSVPGYHDGKPVQVLDRGGAIKGRRLDVLYPTHDIARQWGVQDLEVTVWEYADE
ncbi:MAG: 3D domain-containing protein [Planctomycetota bacterium]